MCKETCYLIFIFSFQGIDYNFFPVPARFSKIYKNGLTCCSTCIMISDEHISPQVAEEVNNNNFVFQVFVETLDKCFENVCELDLIFHMEKVNFITLLSSHPIHSVNKGRERGGVLPLSERTFINGERGGGSN